MPLSLRYPAAMTSRIHLLFLLLGALLATQVLGVHFHMPSAATGTPGHVAAATLINAHQHAGQPDHGHVAAHLYENEQDESEGMGLFAQLGFALLLGAALLLGFLRLASRLENALPAHARCRDAPTPPRRIWASLSPPSQAPPFRR